MADSLTPEKRSWNMSRIKGKDTSIEMKVQKYLFSLGFRYRKNVKTLLGKPLREWISCNGFFNKVMAET